jgi:zona occludens toxin (predicted ATPase)
MVVKVYFGGTGDGKTQGVMRQEVIPALRRGQHVLHNIEGINPGRLCEYCGPEVTPDMVRLYADEQITSPDFWPRFVGLDEFGTRKYDDTYSVFKKGDVLIVDEARQFFAFKTIDGHRERALEYHRHWASEVTGYAADIILIVQTYDKLDKSARDLAKEVYGWQKQTDLGADHKSWRRKYSSPGEKLPKKAPIRETIEFDPEIFTLYASTSIKQATQTESLKKPIWHEKKFKKLAALIAFCFVGGISGLIWSVSSFRGQAFASTGGAPAPGAAPGANVAPVAVPVGEAMPAPGGLRIAGVIYDQGRAKVLLEKGGRLQLVDSADFRITSEGVVGVYQGVQLQWP